MSKKKIFIRLKGGLGINYLFMPLQFTVKKIWGVMF